MITVTGKLKDSTGAALASTPVTFRLFNFETNLPTVIGTNVIVPITTTMTTDSSGNISGTIQGNDTITPLGTLYRVTFGSQTQAPVEAIYNFLGAGPIDLNTYPSLATAPPPTGPLPTNILTSNNIFSGTNSFTAATSLAGGTLAGSYAGNPTLTGTATLNTTIMVGPFTPSTAGGTNLGSTLLPFGAVYLGTAATNNIKQVAVSGMASNAIQTFPEITGNVPVAGGAVDLTGQGAAITATTMFTPKVSGRFRVSAYLKITTPATTGAVTSTLGPVTITYTDPTDSVAQSNVIAMQGAGGTFSNTGVTGNLTTTTLSGTLFIYAKTGVAIQYAIGYASNTAAEMKYEVRIVIEPM